MDIWSGFGFSDDLVNCHLGDFDAWLLHNLKSKRVVCDNLPWFLVFAVCLWFTWKWHFKVVF